jgi:hypothetical protein
MIVFDDTKQTHELYTITVTVYLTDVTQSGNLMSVDFPTASKDLSTTPEEFPITPKGFPIIPKGFPITSKGFPITSKEFPITSKGFPITPKEFPTTPKVHSKTSANYCYELEQVKPSLTVRNISCLLKQQVLSDSHSHDLHIESASRQ